nr:UDP-N-acetylmuramate dehydrogenase [Lactobacillus selangorensis]
MKTDVKAALNGIEVHTNEPLSHYTFTKTGGKADLIAFPTDTAQVRTLVNYAHQEQLPLTVLGNASNLIVRDGGIRGLVLILTQMNTITVHPEQNQVVAAAGARIIDAAETAYHAALSGLEFAAGIPGSIGGAVFMNAGAYGGEIKDVVTSITVMTRDGEIHTISGDGLDFGYRHSVVQEDNGVVLEATFSLTPDDPVAIRARMDDFNGRRAARQPLEYPSCGSVFKRPKGHYTGQLIQEAGLQGRMVGGAQVSTKHAGFIVNVDHATGSDYVNLIHLIQKTIWERFQIHLECEVRIIGEE